MIRFSATLMVLLVWLAVPADARTEREYQAEWCQAVGGEVEVVLSDRTRVDCLTDEYAVEMDFGRKWAESIGQALYYAEMTGRSPGVVLILDDGEERYRRRLEVASRRFGLRVWVIPR